MSSGRRRSAWAAAAVVAAGACLRVWFLRHPNPLSGDTQIYGNIARNLLTHGVYGFTAPPATPVPTLIRLPGYPLFLAACFLMFGMGNFTAVLWVQVGVDLAACGLLALLAKALFGRRPAWLCLGLGCLCPFTANYTAAPLTETLTLASITTAMFCFDRWRRRSELWNGWVGGLGAAMAVSLLLRPEQALLAVVFVLAMLVVAWRRRGVDGARTWLPVVVAAVCVVLPLVPWAARNWRTFHVIQPLAPRYATDPGEAVPLGFQRWYRSWAIDFASTEEVYWNYDGTPILLSDLPERAFDTAQERERTARLLAEYNVTTSPTAALDARFEALARERIRRSPMRYYVWLPMARLGNMLLRPRTELTGVQLAWWRWRDNHAQTAFATVYAGLNLMYLVLGVAGWWRWRRTARGDEAVLLWAVTGFVLLRCGLLMTLDNSEPRYTLELFPVLILCGSALARRISETSSHRL